MTVNGVGDSVLLLLGISFMNPPWLQIDRREAVLKAWNTIFQVNDFIFFLLVGKRKMLVLHLKPAHKTDACELGDHRFSSAYPWV